MYNVRIYKNTGLNAVNIIDNPERLNDPSQFSYDDLQPLDTLQHIFLDSIKVKTDWTRIKAADYVRIGSLTEGYFYYFITGVKMLSADVSLLALTPDFITSAGGIDNVDMLDGIITRCHISDDTYGAYNIEDEFLLPSEPLLLDTYTIDFSQETNVYLESTINLGAMACIATSEAYIDSENESVQVPSTVTNFADTIYQLGDNIGSSTATSLYPSDDIIRDGVNRCRSLGIESAVRAQVCIPTALVSPSLTLEACNLDDDGKILLVHLQNGQIVTEEKSGKLLQGGKWKVVTKLRSDFVDTSTNFKYEYQSVNNNRVLYGSLNKVGIITTAGNRLESNPEDTRSGDTYITIRSVGDPHPTGAPYHRFKTMNGDSSKEGFFINAIKGLSWKQIPIMYAEASGNALNAINFQNSREIADIDYQHSGLGMATSVLQGLGMSKENANFITTVGATAIGGVEGALQGGGVGALTGAFSSGISAEKTILTYDTARRQEMQQFAIQQKIVSPSISISYEGDAFRDFYGERVIVYRYRPTPTDIKRLDTILTMYGYKVNVPAKNMTTNNRKYFNYIMGNVSVGGDIPKWLCDGVSLQISNGVRIWHCKPSSNYYNNNPVV